MDLNEKTQVKEKRKLNKSHLQGFIAGILIMAIITSVGHFINFSNDKNEETNLLGAGPVLQGTVKGAEPKIIRAYPSSVWDDFGKENNFTNYYLGEICLFPDHLPIEGFIKMEDGLTLSTDKYRWLYAVITSDGSSNTATFQLPSVSEQIPLDGLNFYIKSSGIWPERDTEYPHVVDGNIKYFEIPFYEAYRDSYLGEIVLAKNLDENDYNVERILLPCDGRTLNIYEYPELNSIFSNKFGGDGKTTFKLPDLSNVLTPVEGAKYYIVHRGIYPVHDVF